VELCELLADSTWEPVRLLGELGKRSPERLLAVCEAWAAEGDPYRARLAAACARDLLPNAEHESPRRERVLAVLRRLLESEGSAHDEALGALLQTPEAGDEALDEAIARYLADDPVILPSLLGEALTTHFDRVFPAMEEYLDRGGSNTESTLRVLSDVRSVSLDQLRQIVGVTTRVWQTGNEPPYAIALAVESLLYRSETADADAELLAFAERLLRGSDSEVRSPLTYFATINSHGSGVAPHRRVLELLVETAATDNDVWELVATLEGDEAWIDDALDLILARAARDPQADDQVVYAAMNTRHDAVAAALARRCGEGRPFSGPTAAAFAEVVARGESPRNAAFAVLMPDA
jgi:hypothetical protein